MDWTGCYLMELTEDGKKMKIQLSDDEIYFMMVNGIKVKEVKGWV